MALLEVWLKTHVEDDLRGGSWADLVVKLAGQAPITFPRFTGMNGLPGGSLEKHTVDLPILTDPGQIEFFQILHVSQEIFGQTRDNWSLEHVEFKVKIQGSWTVTVAEHGYFRFTGSSPLLTIYPARP